MSHWPYRVMKDRCWWGWTRPKSYAQPCLSRTTGETNLMARILVEDHAELVELLQAVLEGEGHTVDDVLGGQAALGGWGV